MAYNDHIVRDPAICGGQAVIRGTRVLVRIILDYLVHGEPIEAILREFPSLTEDDVRAVSAFAATSASEDLLCGRPDLYGSLPATRSFPGKEEIREDVGRERGKTVHRLIQP